MNLIVEDDMVRPHPGGFYLALRRPAPGFGSKDMLCAENNHG
jgi:hypothetical protein